MMSVEGLACGCLNPIVDATVYGRVPPRLRGRVLGTMTSAALLVTPFGALAAGYAVGAAGLDATLLGVAGLYLLVTLVPATNPVWRGMDTPAAGELPAADPGAGLSWAEAER
jgi:hypothetical protein